MKNILKSTNLPWITLACGGVGLLLQLWLLGTADEKGFVASGHISGILLWILTAGVLALLLLLTRDLQEANKFSFNFPASDVGALGSLVGALGLAVSSVAELAQWEDAVATAAAVFGVACAVTLVFLAQCRRKGQRPNSLFHVLICIYMAFRLISLYRRWNSDPQIQDYCFQLLATICLMLAAYYRANFDAGMGNRRSYAFFNLAAVYLCCLSLTSWAQVPFYLGCGAWMVTDMCNLRPLPRGAFRRSNAAPEEQS